MSSKQRYKYGLCFASQDAIECVIRFNVDGCTVKRGALIGKFSHLEPLDGYPWMGDHPWICNVWLKYWMSLDCIEKGIYHEDARFPSL
jgi:hypothetical protein